MQIGKPSTLSCCIKLISLGLVYPFNSAFTGNFPHVHWFVGKKPQNAKQGKWSTKRCFLSCNTTYDGLPTPTLMMSTNIVFLSLLIKVPQLMKKQTILLASPKMYLVVQNTVTCSKLLCIGASGPECSGLPPISELGHLDEALLEAGQRRVPVFSLLEHRCMFLFMLENGTKAK